MDLTRKEKHAYETISKMDIKIDKLEIDLKNAVRRGDELYDQLENTKAELRLAESKIERLKDMIGHREDCAFNDESSSIEECDCGREKEAENIINEIYSGVFD